MRAVHTKAPGERRVAVACYGNTGSVISAFERLGVPAVLTLAETEIRGADAIVLPGCVAFKTAMRTLNDAGLVSALEAAANEQHTPILGIGVGMQVLFEGSNEMGSTTGLGLLAGEVSRLPATAKHLVPHLSWKPVHFTRPSPLADGLPDPSSFYHMHSFAAVPADDADILALTEHAEAFVSAIQRENVFGVQFHPEKSSADGLRLLSNFAQHAGFPEPRDP
jgi:glutamine amidotransferase